jgi:hypothetical protein
VHEIINKRVLWVPLQLIRAQQVSTMSNNGRKQPKATNVSEAMANSKDSGSVSICAAGTALYPAYASRFPACFPTTSFLSPPRLFAKLTDLQGCIAIKDALQRGNKSSGYKPST